MKILFLDSPAFAKHDMVEAFKECNIDVQLFFHEDYQERRSAAFNGALSVVLENEPFDFVFSFNYFPSISNCCQKHNVKYVSYVYDSPLVALYSYSLINSCNYVFLFDKETYLTFKNAGISTVYYLPLAANVKRLTNMPTNSQLKDALTADVSFVGSLYNEEHNFFERLTGISEHTKGYLDGIMLAQQKIYGQFFLEELLTKDILADIQQSVPYSPMADGTETAAYVYANYFLCRKITANERISLLKQVSDHFHTKIYTHKAPSEIPNAEFMGTVDYYDLMPLVFKNSVINLNVTLRSIHTGIPLRCMDIMGSGSFLLTNFQSDFLDHFVPGEDFIYYESEDDCLAKIDYFLRHDAERTQIIANCVGKMAEQHTFVHRVREILNTI